MLYRHDLYGYRYRVQYGSENLKEFFHQLKFPICKFYYKDKHCFY